VGAKGTGASGSCMINTSCSVPSGMEDHSSWGEMLSPIPGKAHFRGKGELAWKSLLERGIVTGMGESSGSLQIREES